MLDLWWQTTKLMYLYYWHQRIWAVLATWAVLILLLILLVLLGEELWRAGYRTALQSAAAPETRTCDRNPLLLQRDRSRSAGFSPHHRRPFRAFGVSFLADATRADRRVRVGPLPPNGRVAPRGRGDAISRVRSGRSAVRTESPALPDSLTEEQAEQYECNDESPGQCPPRCSTFLHGTHSDLPVLSGRMSPSE